MPSKAQLSSAIKPRPHLNQILLAMFRDSPDPGPLSDQGKARERGIHRVTELSPSKSRLGCAMDAHVLKTASEG